MPHADSSFVPADLRDKAAFYAHVNESLLPSIEGQNWVSALANAASLLYFSYLSSPLYGQE
jgi:L-methionine (R)-S-oxide reductase